MMNNEKSGNWLFWGKVIMFIGTLITAGVRIWESKRNQKSAKEQQAQKHADKMEELKRENDLKNQNAEEEHRRKMEEMKFANDLKQQNAAADYVRKMEEAAQQHARRMEILATKNRRTETESEPIDSIEKAELGSEILERVKNAPLEKDNINEVMPNNGICFITGMPKGGKTTFAKQLSVSLRHGTYCEALPEAFNTDPENHLKVLYYDTEMSDKDWNRIAGNTPGFRDLKLIRKRSWPSVKSLLQDIKRQLLDPEMKCNCGIVIDNIAGVGKGCCFDEEATELISGLKSIIEERQREGLNTSIYIVIHWKKGADLKNLTSNNIRGNGKMIAQANLVISMIPTKEKGRVLMKMSDIRAAGGPDGCLLLERICEPGNHRYKFVKIADETVALGQSEKADLPTKKNLREYRKISSDEKFEVAKQVCNLDEQGMSLREIADEIGKNMGISITHPTVQEILKANDKA